MIKFNNKGKYWFLILLAYFTIVYVLFNKLNITCVFLKILGIPCPGCGMTRAAISLLKLDFISAIKYNIIVFFMPYVVAYIFLDLKGRVHNYLMIGIALVAVVNWMLKLIITL